MSEILAIDLLQRRAETLKQRRHFFRKTSGIAAGLVGGAFLGACGGGSDDVHAAGPSDPEILNFALNLEYLEAQFYAYAAHGTGLDAGMLTGVGTQGTVTTGARAVTFTDPVVRQYAREIAADEVAHVAFLRRELASSAVAMPAIDIGVSPTSAFSNAARAAGLIGPGQTFDPYESDANFLLAAFIFEDVGVTAYKGAAPLITNPTYLSAAAGILAVEAYHAGLIRGTLYAKGVTTAALRAGADAISDARDSLDGPDDVDQGISPSDDTSNIVPTDADGIAFGRNPGDVLNIVYLNNGAAANGGFFPAGVNGTIAMSSAD